MTYPDKINGQYWHNYYQSQVRTSDYRTHIPDGLWTFRTTVDLRPISRRKTHVTMVMIDEFPNGFPNRGHTEFDCDLVKRPNGPYTRLFYRYECPANRRDDWKEKGCTYFPFGAIAVVWEQAL